MLTAFLIILAVPMHAAVQPHERLGAVEVAVCLITALSMACGGCLSAVSFKLAAKDSGMVGVSAVSTCIFGGCYLGFLLAFIMIASTLESGWAFSYYSGAQKDQAAPWKPTCALRTTPNPSWCAPVTWHRDCSADKPVWSEGDISGGGGNGSTNSTPPADDAPMY